MGAARLAGSPAADRPEPVLRILAIEDLLALDRGLSALEQFDPRKCRTVELRYFVGLSMEEIAQTLEVSEITVRRDLRMAEAWLQRSIEGG